MANKPISMSKIRQILRLYSQGSSNLAINRLTGISRNTLGDSGDKDHLIPEQIDQVIVWRKTEQISWRSF